MNNTNNQEQLNQNAIKINNLFFYKDSKPSGVFKIIGVIGFTLYCYLLIKQGQDTSLDITIKTIEQKTKIATKKTISDYLKLLHKKKLITIFSPEISEKSFNYNDLLEISVSTKISDINSKYTLMSVELFKNKIKQIKSYGWSILCLLSMFHNYSYSNVQWHYGYANPSLKTIQEILHISETTIKKYLNILENNQLIKKEKQESIYIPEDEIFNNFNNHYIVYSRIPGNKYYLKALDKLIEYARQK